MQHRMGQLRRAGTMIVGRVSTNSQNTNPGPPKFHVLRRTQPQPIQHTFVLECAAGISSYGQRYCVHSHLLLFFLRRICEQSTLSNRHHLCTKELLNRSLVLCISKPIVVLIPNTLPSSCP
jgi:hypothetical protein